MTDSHSDVAARRIALLLEYDGTAFSGWQKQSAPELPTVQGALEQALSKVADRGVTVSCAGRTDAGVHATCQVCHFDTAVDRDRKAWTRGVNSLLPGTVRVLEAREMDSGFHARFSATARRYFYVLHRRSVASAILTGKVTVWRRELDLAAMNAAAESLTGERDFSAFRAAGCQSRSPKRNVHHARLFSQGEFLVFDIQANAFLQHMVRNIMGSLLDVGAGVQPPGWIKSLLEGRDRRRASATAPADGLYLVGVHYPEQYELTSRLLRPPFLGSQP